MKANAPEKLYYTPYGDIGESHPITDNDIEYLRTDAFIEKARKWFGQQPETYDANGVRVYGDKDFEDFKKYIKGK